MKCSVLVVVALFALVSANPVPASDDLQLVQIPLQGNKEIDILSVADNAGDSSDRNKRTIGILRELFPELSKVAIDGADADSVDMAALSEKLESISRVVRQTQAAQAQAASVNAAAEPNSAAAVAAEVLQTAASSNAVQQEADKSSALDELSLDDDSVVDDNRNKRFLNFGFGGSSGGAGGSGAASGGSGNFLFDIIRLVSGSSGTEQTDEKDNAPEADAGKGADGYTEGIPGPVTRLIVLANRGLSNLIQDLILRIAATSERVVNFKARLITSLI